MAKPQKYIVRTLLSEEDQSKAREFLLGNSGRRIMAWLRENTPVRVGNSKEEYIAHSGKVSGYEEALLNLCRIPGADIDDLNFSALDTNSDSDDSTVDLFKSVSEGKLSSTRK